MENNKLQVVEKRIRELNPELMELSFGCVVNPNAEGAYHVYRELIGGYVEAVHVGYDEGSLVVGQKERILPKTIIGHPIHLEHVLSTIKEVLGKKLPNASPIFASQQLGSYVKSLVKIYNLSLPFTEQPQEVYDFLYEVLISNGVVVNVSTNLKRNNMLRIPIHKEIVVQDQPKRELAPDFEYVEFMPRADVPVKEVYYHVISKKGVLFSVVNVQRLMEGHPMKEMRGYFNFWEAIPIKNNRLQTESMLRAPTVSELAKLIWDY